MGCGDGLARLIEDERLWEAGISISWEIDRLRVLEPCMSEEGSSSSSSSSSKIVGVLAGLKETWSADATSTASASSNTDGALAFCTRTGSSSSRDMEPMTIWCRSV